MVITICIFKLADDGSGRYDITVDLVLSFNDKGIRLWKIL